MKPEIEREAFWLAIDFDCRIAIESASF